MKKTDRLLEIMLYMNNKRKFKVQELADHFAVSRRTMLKDLQALSEMGGPLASAFGVHGGYSVMKS
ncbi:helix-turn-helix transcriptional regulator [Neobacillus terrae]|uniref:helix-turn-helix transcriptional regulator n=1 Tax=Neobacillus terrae TaxID=3034837 RepID=UPI00140BA0B1|nr:HTH domain-containing protein [Neobacillus terrae]NHM33894.1 HTH domain-containing protein [Neobacillus terrae]